MQVAGLCVFVSLLGVVASALIVSSHQHDAVGDEADQPRGPRTFDVQMRSIQYSPVQLTVQVGDTVRWVNGDSVPHTVTPADKSTWGTQGSGDAPSMWLERGDSWSFTFSAPGVYAYFCIPHAALQADGSYAGMVGTVVVTEEAAGAPPAGEEHGPAAAQPVDVAEIGADATQVPAPAPGGHVRLDITSRELVATMADGVTFRYWTFDGQVPGRMLRVHVGDIVTVNFTNAADSLVGHNVDFHAVTGPGGGAAVLSALPGETKQLAFEALQPGLFVYHCAYQDPPLHVAHGMYGLILVEPEGGLPPVDREFYVVQGDFYSGFAGSAKGHHEHSETSAEAEEPTFVVFNGRVGSLHDEHRALQAQVGQTVRIYFGVGGPNLVSSFHVIGEIFDRVYNQGDVRSPPQQAVQTTLVPAGGAVIVDFTLEVPGDYVLVDHSLYRVHKGASGILHVTGEGEPGVFEPRDEADPGGH
jgi:nitrite reductase (NO-forming)